MLTCTSRPRCASGASVILVSSRARSVVHASRRRCASSMMDAPGATHTEATMPVVSKTTVSSSAIARTTSERTKASGMSRPRARITACELYSPPLCGVPSDPATIPTTRAGSVATTEGVSDSVTSTRSPSCPSRSDSTDRWSWPRPSSRRARTSSSRSVDTWEVAPLIACSAVSPSSTRANSRGPSSARIATSGTKSSASAGPSRRMRRSTPRVACGIARATRSRSCSAVPAVRRGSRSVAHTTALPIAIPSTTAAPASGPHSGVIGPSGRVVGGVTPRPFFRRLDEDHGARRLPCVASRVKRGRPCARRRVPPRW